MFSTIPTMGTSLSLQKVTDLRESSSATSWGVVMMTGGLALDPGLVAALEEDVAKIKDMKTTIRSHPDSIYAGAIGAALWGAYRFEKLAAQGDMPKAA